MFKTYLKSGWRNILKNKTHAFLNISGLSVGMAVALLIGLWIWDELSFDGGNKNYSHIAQLARKEITNKEAHISSDGNHFPIPLADVLRTNYNDLFSQVSLATEESKHILEFNGNKFSEKGMYVEKAFTDIFTFKMTATAGGDFFKPNSILVSSSVAKSLFGKSDIIGQVIKLDNAQPLTVTGVFEDQPVNSTFSDIQFLCPWGLLVNTNEGVKAILDNWGNSSVHIFVQTQPAMTGAKVSAAIRDIYWQHIKDGQVQTAGTRVDLFLHPMKDWHLRSEWKNGVQAGGQIRTVWLFGLTGIFVLLLACINFMNLSTARSEKRAKEVGIRKAVGSLRSQLIKQFMAESLLSVTFAFILSMLLVLACLHPFNLMADKNISFPFSNPVFWLLSVLFVLLTSLVAGSYPALYLSSFRPVKVLKGTLKLGRFSAVPRKALLAVQFTVSIVLVIGTIVVYQQIRFAQERPVGYDRKGLVRIATTTPDLNDKYDVLQKELLSSGGAVGFARSSAATTENNYFDDHFEWEGKNKNLANQSFALMAVTCDYGKTVGWQFSEGRDFSRDFASDNKAVILNETAVKYMQLRHPVGTSIKWNNNLFTVVGVIKDMVKESPYKGVQQSFFFMVPNVGPDIVIRLNPGLKATDALSRIAPIFSRLNPSAPFEYSFVDDDYARKFAAEQRIGLLAKVFTLLAIFISCLGIFGMASFVAEQRVKEIGVRKVLGASVFGLWQLLSKDFIVLVFIAFLVAAPVAYYFTNEWLQSYEYRAGFSAWIFVATGLGALVIVLLTVSFQSVKAALANPIKSLRTE